MVHEQSNWIEYWNRDPPIYVNDHHKAVHYRMVARDIIAHLPCAQPVVLDYGCGEALSARDVATHCSRLILCDAAPQVRERLKARFRDTPRIVVQKTEALEQLADQSIDLVVANSVIQYLSREQLTTLLSLWRRKLARDGHLILGDVVPRDATAIADVRALLTLARQHRFLAGAVVGLVRILVSDYRKLRNRLGFMHFNEDEILALLMDHGFVARRLPVNFGHNPARMTFQARHA